MNNPMNHPSPAEFSLVLAAGTAQEYTVAGPKEAGSLAVDYDFLSYDEAGGVQDVGVTVRPERRSELFGGDTRHYFKTQPTVGTNNRHMIRLGFRLEAGEDLKLNFLSATGGTFRFRVGRQVVFPAL